METLSISLQLIGVIITAGSVIYAAHVASKWPEKNERIKDRRELNYNIGLLKFLSSTITFYIALDVGDIEEEFTDVSESLTKTDILVGNEMEALYKEIHDRRSLISHEFNHPDEIQQFLDFLFYLGGCVIERDSGPTRQPDEWHFVNEELKKLITTLESKRVGTRTKNK